MKRKNLTIINVAYLALPFVIFMLGFLKPVVGVPMTLVALGCIYCFIRSDKDDSVLSVSLGPQLLILLFAFVLCLFAGIGGFHTQSGDFWVKNALLHDLCNYSWPLYLNLAEQSQEVQEAIGSDRVAFVYYLFFYLPAAVVGRIGGEMGVRITFLLWSTLGLYLVLLNTAGHVLNKKIHSIKIVAGILLLFFVFGGLDIIGSYRIFRHLSWQQLMYFVPLVSFCEAWCQPYFTLYGGNIYDLLWVFNQCIPVWLITVMILDRKNNKSLFFLYSFSLLYSPWSAIGLLPMVIWLWLRDNQDKWLSWHDFRQTFSFYNVLFPLLLLFVVGTYYLTNHSTSYSGFSFEFMTFRHFCFYYPLFLLIEIGVYVCFLWKNILHSPILQVSVVVLIVLPFYWISPLNDLLMRASIPALFVVWVVWSKYVLVNFKKQKMILILVLFLTSFSSTHEVCRSLRPLYVTHEIDIVNPIGSFRNLRSFYATTAQYNFFSYQYEDTFFFKYLAKKPQD